MPAVKMLPPVMLLVALTKPAVNKLPPITLATALILVFAVIAPVTLKLVPVAAPMFGVVKFAPALTIMLPLPSNAVVLLSTSALNTVPVKLIPALVLAV